ncbi:MAG: hypothetical protein ACFFCW_40225 [Candidatus Hodarchaeota archaeon]
MNRFLTTKALSIFFLPLIFAFSVYAEKPCKDLTGETGYFPNETILSGEKKREYILYVPTNYLSNTPTPLVFNLHGLGSEPSAHYRYTKMNELADKHTFALVTPKAIGGWDDSPSSYDVKFVSDIIDKLSEKYWYRSLVLARSKI